MSGLELVESVCSRVRMSVAWLLWDPSLVLGPQNKVPTVCFLIGPANTFIETFAEIKTKR